MATNYTTYDVRRAHDILWPGTSRNNIIMLAHDDTQGHTYDYAQILKIYHANVIYIGPGSQDYRSRRLDLLYVRHYKHLPGQASHWQQCKLERLHFPPIVQEDAFSFLDPELVIRGAHIIPAFAHGLKHAGEPGLSAKELANDGAEWRQYYVSW